MFPDVCNRIIHKFFPGGIPGGGQRARMTIQELKEKMDRGEQIVILDVRSGEDYSRSQVKIAGAVRIPMDQLKDRSKELPADREIIAYCA